MFAVSAELSKGFFMTDMTVIQDQKGNCHGSHRIREIIFRS
jgi:hypothetical protein